MAGNFTFKIVNNRTSDAQRIHLLLTGSSPRSLTGIDLGESTALTDFYSQNPNGEFSAEQLVSARLYVGYNVFPEAPDPQSNQYYGWIEFSKSDNDEGVWLNLSNVDIVGLPLTLKGAAVDRKPFSLGYKRSVKDIVQDLRTQALTSPTNPAVIDCGGGKIKIVAPNIQFGCYPPYDGYLNDLSSAGAPLTIQTDTPVNGEAKTFTGSFLKAASGSDPIISLTSGSDTFSILQSQFSTEYLYRCDGGTVIYNGQTVNQNRPDDGGKDASAVYTNSLFRNLCVGMNEGYFTPGGPNDSSKFEDLEPFQDGQGNVYAEIVYKNTNSYGFPYADMNLKTLVVARVDTTITMTILRDDQANDYAAERRSKRSLRAGRSRSFARRRKKGLFS